MEVILRRMDHSDIGAVKSLIEKTLSHKSMLKVYEETDMAIWDELYDLYTLADIVETCHAYVLCDKETGRVVASGYIRLEDEGRHGYIGMIFTDYEVQKLGLGKKMIAALEADEYGRSCEKLVLSAALSAFNFYRKLGYRCRDNEYTIEATVDDLLAVPMEKFVEK